jgi:predicted negative regulator of RcsB-dependent stress response
MASDATQPGGLVGFLAWVEVNKKRLVTGGGIAILVIVAAVVFIQQQSQKEYSASEALSNVRVPFNSGNPVPPGTAEALLKVANDHRGTRAAARALLLSAGVLFAEAKSAADYAEAEKRFSQVIQNYPDSEWLTQANRGIAASLAAQGKTPEATAKYEEIRLRSANAPIIDEVRIALARLYESQKPEEAFKLYEEVLKNPQGNPNGPLVAEAGMHQEALIKQHPNLAALKQAAAAPPVTPLQNQQVKITPMTNRIATTISNTANRVITNLQQLTITNRPGATSQPIQIKLNPTPTPGAPNATPPPATK